MAKKARKVIKIIPQAKLKINSYALGYTLAILSAICMLLISIAGKLGFGLDAVGIMQKFHFMYSLTPGGIIGGMAEAALWGLLSGFLVGWLYNKFA